MTITPSMIYWITRLDGIECIAVIGLVICMVVGILLGIAWGIEVVDYPREEVLNVLRWIRKCWLWCFIPLGLVALFVPTKREVVAMYIIPAVANNESVQQIVSDVPEIAALGFEWLKESLTPDVISIKVGDK